MKNKTNINNKKENKKEIEMYNKIQEQIKEILRIVEKDCTSQEWVDRYLPELETLLSIRDKMKRPMNV